MKTIQDNLLQRGRCVKKVRILAGILGIVEGAPSGERGNQRSRSGRKKWHGLDKKQNKII